VSVLLTGASGYLGGNVLRRLVGQGVTVTALANSHPVTLSAPTVDAVSTDLTDRGALFRMVARVAPSTVIHLAARLPNSEATGSMAENVETTRNLVDACNDSQVRRLVFASTISVYPAWPADGIAHAEGDPLAPGEPYGESKREAEMLVRRWGEAGDRSAVILRFAGIHGPPRRSGVVYRFFEAAVRGTPLRVSEPNAVFSMLFVDDAARATLVAAEKPSQFGVHTFNIGGGDMVSLAEVAHRVVAACDSASEIHCDQAPARRATLAIDRARSELCFAPASLDDNLRNALGDLS
jgi:nucleoside-diphosphate-sugar epimerase